MREEVQMYLLKVKHLASGGSRGPVQVFLTLKSALFTPLCTVSLSSASVQNGHTARVRSLIDLFSLKDGQILTHSEMV